jgi:peptidoglycan/LPS O-acetylase OafA/YrhL
MQYRPDIDGLRAVAVLSVILFHINKHFIPGGFIGVDIFFVISGYLITSHIVGSLGRQQFSLAEFYRRRIKRIVPAMLTVVAVTLFAALVLMRPDDAVAVSKSAVWSTLSMANVHFWLHQDASYFAASSLEQPLLHLWSLGVEEQFYLIWPLVLMWLYRPGQAKRFWIAAAGVAIASFLLGNLVYARDSSFVYYMLPTRAGELLFGALAAMAQRWPHSKWQPNSTVAGILGPVVIIVSLLFISEDDAFPGVLAIVPALGATLTIIGGRRPSNLISKLLSTRPVVFIGLISYSAYLWHWPLLAFYRYGYGEVTLVAGAVIFALTLLLAWLTYHFIEQPFRRNSAPLPTLFLRQVAFPSGLLCIVAIVSIYWARWWPELTHTPYRQQLIAISDKTKPAFAFDYVCQPQRAGPRDIVQPGCVIGPAQSRREIVLWGDSNAAHYIGMLGTFADKAGFRFRNLEVGACPPLTSDPAPFVDPRRLADCRASIAAAQPLLARADTLIISASWTTYLEKSPDFLDAFFKTVRELTASGKTVILIGKVPEIQGFDRLCPEKSLTYPFLDCQHWTAVNMPEHIAAANVRLAKFSEHTAHVTYFDANRYLCPAGGCRAFTKEGSPLYYDRSHLSMAGSWELGRRIFETEGVPKIFLALVR